MICASVSAEVHINPAGLGVLQNPEPLERAKVSQEAHSTKDHSQARKLRSVTIAGPAGRLEGLLNEGASDAPFSALVCHPHPLRGGTMHNKVVYHAMQVMNRRHWGFELPVLRFDFRGVGLSEGQHDGKAEFEDVRAALDWLEHEFARPIVVAGFSFGAAMALKACCAAKGLDSTEPDPRVKAVAALGLPTEADGRTHRYSFLEKAILPKLFLSGMRDEFTQPGQLESVVAHAAEPSRLIFVPGADHFFTHKLSAMQRAFAGWLKEQLA
ncbi:MAG: alpha/beta hydrolase [Terracidiphilus sp.]